MKPNGSEILVTNANKQEFARLKCHYAAYTSTKSQLEQIRRGFYELIPLDWFKFFSVGELESFMCGL